MQSCGAVAVLGITSDVEVVHSRYNVQSSELDWPVPQLVLAIFQIDETMKNTSRKSNGDTAGTSQRCMNLHASEAAISFKGTAIPCGSEDGRSDSGCGLL